MELNETPQEMITADEVGQFEEEPVEVSTLTAEEQAPEPEQEEAGNEESLYEKLLKTLTLKQKEGQDLANIKSINPEIESLEQLGEDYAKLMQTGLVDAVTAYYATTGRATTFTPSDDGKAHLVKSGGAIGVPTGKDIPRDQLAEWQEMFPDANSARLREIYNSALNAVG